MTQQRMQRPGGGPGGGHGGPMGAMGRPVEKAKDFKGTTSRLVDYLSPQKFSFIVVLIFAIASTIFNILGPKVMGKATTKLGEGILVKYMHYMRLQLAIQKKMPMTVINNIKNQPIPSIDFTYIGRILLMMVILYIISALFSFMMSYIMASVSQKTVYTMRNDVKSKLDRLPLKYFDSHTHGEILSRVTNDMDNIATTLQQSLTQLITSFVTVIGILIMMLTISPVMTLIAIVTLPASMLITAFVAKKSQKYFADQQKSLGALNGHVEEMYTGHKIVKAFGHEEDSIAKFEKINERLYNVGWKAQFMSGVIFPALNFVNNIGYVVICVVGGLMVAKKKIEIGDIQAFIQYMRQFTQPIVQLANIANVIQSTVASAERVFEVLDETEETADREDSSVINFPKGEVKFEHVRFGYKEDAILMEDLSIDVEEGQTIAIVGPTGAGKTTLVNLLMRFYEIQGGRITVDGVDIKTLPEGYNTVLNEEASNISQGQKQLLTIARAILADPSMLILDEATSNVDTRTEVLIQKAMTNLMKGRTSFVIAHRLSTIRDADLILVMNHGAIIEQGSHKALLDKGGFYADLYNSQFTGADLGNEAV